jgi:DNA (cytosine-5)-methyltransferase 1
MSRERPLLLDLFCGAGGCAAGYHRAGFDVVGVDLHPQPNYPFEFHRADAFEFLAAHGWRFAAVHASPPCQNYSSITHLRGARADHPDLVAPTRDALAATGKPWVMENVPRSPLRSPAVLCGSAFNLMVRRHRLFESNFPLPGSGCRHKDAYAAHGRPIAVYGHPGGGASSNTCTRERKGSLAVWKQAMGVDWMKARELAQAIPPAYTEYVGRHLMEHLRG